MFHDSIALFFTSQVQEKLGGKLKVTEAAFSYSFFILNFYFNFKSYEKQEGIFDQNYQLRLLYEC